MPSRVLARIATTGIYLLHDVPRDLQRAARVRAGREGITLRWVLLQALREYAAGTWVPQPDEKSCETPLANAGDRRLVAEGARMTTSIALALIFLFSLAATRSADGEVPTAADFAACNAEAPEAVKAGTVWPTRGDYVRADSARAGAVTVDPIDFRGKVIESSDPQIHGIKVEGAKEAMYQAAYRGCMRRKGF